VGWIIATLLNQGPLTMSLIVLTIFLQVVLFRSRWGLRTRAVGEHPKAAETVGVDVIRLRYRNVTLAGGLAVLQPLRMDLGVTGIARHVAQQAQALDVGDGFDVED